MNKYVIAADGGGSKTEYLLLSDTGVVAGRIVRGGTNPVSVGREKSLALLRSGIGELLAAAGVGTAQILGAVFCLPYWWRKPEIIDGTFADFPCETLSDVMAALYGTLGERTGVCLLSGTGSFAVGRDKKGIIRVGGWGGAFGDEGSGYHIGLSLLRAASREWDDGAPGEFCSAVCRHFRLANLEELKEIQANCSRFNTEAVAGLCPAVFDLAESGNAPAMDILNESGRLLAQLAARCAGRLEFEGGTAPCVLTGGVARDERSFLKESIRTHLRELCPQLVFSAAGHQPAAGAAYRALVRFFPESKVGLERLRGQVAAITNADALPGLKGKATI